MEPELTSGFSGLTDLVSERVGGRALAASDEFFAPKGNLLKPGNAIFIPDKYTARGKWMDGWETRRKRTPGHDWCILQLGLAGMIRGLDIDTSHFLGNNPSYASLDALASEKTLPPKSFASRSAHWTEVLPKSPLKPGSHNFFPLSSPERWTHLRLNIFPDGGVARFRAFGTVLPDWSKLGKSKNLDLAAVEHGGLVVAASDMFFGSKENLILPGRAGNMGDGWETKRRRGPGHDWAIVRLGKPGTIAKIEIDTNHFKGNYPDRCSIDVCYEPARAIDSLTWTEADWTEVLSMTPLRPHARHLFQKELKSRGPVSHVRLNIFPDGGVSRLRVWGSASL